MIETFRRLVSDMAGDVNDHVDLMLGHPELPKPGELTLAHCGMVGCDPGGQRDHRYDGRVQRWLLLHRLDDLMDG
jgi:hypothetical protein